MRYALVGAFVLLTGSASAAYHCPYGQIYRVHLDECVGVHSALARAYVKRPIHILVHKIDVEPPLDPIIVNPDSIFPPEAIHELNKQLDKLHSQ